VEAAEFACWVFVVVVVVVVVGVDDDDNAAMDTGDLSCVSESFLEFAI